MEKEGLNEGFKEGFVDPAIVSYGRPEGYLAPDAKVNGAPMSTSQTAMHSRIEPSPRAISLISAEPATTGAQSDVQDLRSAVHSMKITPFATLTAPFNDLSLNGDTHEEGLDLVDDKTLKHQDTELLELKEVAQGRAPSSRKRARKSGAKGGHCPLTYRTCPIWNHILPRYRHRNGGEKARAGGRPRSSKKLQPRHPHHKQDNVGSAPKKTP